MKKAALFLLVLLLATLAPSPADYVIVQKVEGGMQAGNMTMKIKGARARADIAPAISQIVDGASGEVITLLHAQKAWMKIPAEQIKALVAQMRKLQGDAKEAKPALTPTGRKEKVGQYDTEIFTWSAGSITITYWIAKSFPDYAAVLAALDKVQQAGLASATKGISPGAADFPGMWVKTEMTLNGQKVITTLVSLKQENVDPVVFSIPGDYKELATPALPTPPAAPK